MSSMGWATETLDYLSPGNDIAIVAAYIAIFLALMVLGMTMRVLALARTAHKEQLVLLLAMAAHAGVSPDSPEFLRAQEAIEGKAKPKKEHKSRKAKKAEAAKAA
jgi:hypothetical protein